MLCDYFFSGSSNNNSNDSGLIGRSYICIKYPERGWFEPGCFFMYLQEFNRSSPLCAIIETAVLVSICISALPCNIVAVANFYIRRVNNQLLILLSVLAICNVTIASLGLLIAATRLQEDWIFGQFGCSIYFGGSVVMFCMSVWAMVIISFERYLTVTTNRPFGGLGIYATIALLLFLFAVDIGIWSYPYFYLEIAQVKRMTINGANNKNSTVNVCTLFTYHLPDDGFLQSLFLSIVVFGIPMLVASFNYWKIRQHVTMEFRTKRLDLRRQSSFQRQSVAYNNTLLESMTDTERTKLFTALRQNDQNTFISRLTLSSTIVAVLLNLPFLIVMALISKDTIDDNFSSSVLITALYLAYANSAVNPLIQSFIPVSVNTAYVPRVKSNQQIV